MIKEVDDIRDGFFDDLLEKFKNDKKVYFITADQGTFKLQEFQKYDESRAINVGISEQHLISFASGLAKSGNIVYIYAISTFLIFRAFEQIKVDLVLNNSNVKMIGMGTGFCYSKDGPTHHSLEDIGVLRGYKNINIYTPSNAITSKLISRKVYKNKGLDYVRLDKGSYNFNNSYTIKNHLENLVIFKKGKFKKCIISHGVILNSVYKIYFNRSDVQIIDVYKLNNLSRKTLDILSEFNKVVVIEESVTSSSFGSMLDSYLFNKNINLIKIGVDNINNYHYGDRDFLIDKLILNKKNIKLIENFLE